MAVYCRRQSANCSMESQSQGYAAKQTTIDTPMASVSVMLQRKARRDRGWNLARERMDARKETGRPQAGESVLILKKVHENTLLLYYRLAHTLAPLGGLRKAWEIRDAEFGDGEKNYILKVMEFCYDMPVVQFTLDSKDRGPSMVLSFTEWSSITGRDVKAKAELYFHMLSRKSFAWLSLLSSRTLRTWRGSRVAGNLTLLLLQHSL